MTALVFIAWVGLAILAALLLARAVQIADEHAARSWRHDVETQAPDRVA